jgi:3-oxoadipate enol-lactonase
MLQAEVRLQGRRLSYREAGAGEPLVLIHGFPMHAGLWEPQLRAVPRGWRFIAPDLRGFGAAAPVASGEAPLPRSMDEYAAELELLLDHLGLGRPVLGGLSMGGYVAFALMRRQPERFHALVLADTRPQADTEEGRAKRREMQKLARRGGAAAMAGEMVPKLLGADTRRERPELAETVRALIEPHAPDALIAALEAMLTRPDSTPDLPSIRCPVLIIVGQQDVLTPPADSETMHHLVPESHLVVIPGAGHVPNLEQPDAFNAALAAFLSERVR